MSVLSVLFFISRSSWNGPSQAIYCKGSSHLVISSHLSPKMHPTALAMYLSNKTSSCINMYIGVVRNSHTVICAIYTHRCMHSLYVLFYMYIFPMNTVILRNCKSNTSSFVEIFRIIFLAFVHFFEILFGRMLFPRCVFANGLVCFQLLWVSWERTAGSHNTVQEREGRTS